MINLKLPDGSSMKVEKGVSVLDFAKKISNSLARDAICASIDGELVDLSFKIEKDCSIEIVTKDDERALEVLRHTASHVMAQAVKRLYDDVKIAIGPAIEDGFYYDFDMSKRLSDDELVDIEKEMKNIIKEDLIIERKELNKDKAKKLFKKRNESYKIELVDDIEKDVVSVYSQGEFIDLCRGPHLERTSKLNHYKLMNVAGAYWRGDENNKMLQRIYGTAFFKKKNLQKYLETIKEAKKRDHRKIGKQMDLFSIHPEYGPGLIYWHSTGAFIRKQLEDFMTDNLIERGYSLVNTPHIGKKELWETSGHWKNFREDMYNPMDIDDDKYCLKPMNCPFHILIYGNDKKSYRDLPIRMAEFGTFYRYERSGTLHGLSRVRGITQDDAHVFCTPDQLEDEVLELIDFSLMVLDTFGFEYHVFLGTKPEEKCIGSDKMWNKATSTLKNALEKKGLDYKVKEGDGAFYGPKIDIIVNDALNREWDLSTIQIDFNLPERFDINYVGEDGDEHRPVMIHRALLGSIERFFGILIEHFAGKFPTWMMPTQVMIIPVSDNHLDYAEKVKNRLTNENIRVKIDSRNENVGYKIRETQVDKKIPYMLIVGDNEIEDNTVSVRDREGEDRGKTSLDNFINNIKKEIEEKRV